MVVALAYIAAVVAANITVALFGPVITPINAFIFIGLDLSLRNLLGVKWPPLKMLALIAFAGLVSYLFNPASGVIALASVCAFVGAAIADWLTFRAISGEWFRRCMGGVTVGAAVDSLLFPTIAFGAILPSIVAAQFAAQVLGGALWAGLIVRLQKDAL